MSNYIKTTKHPVSGKWEEAEWLDNEMGSHQYGVRFPSNRDTVYNPEEFKLETKEKTMKDQPTSWEKHEACFCDDCLVAYYCQPCGGCKDGHPSFWKTVIESPQWKKWHEYAGPKMLYDFPEVEELGIIGERHFQDFIKFTVDSH